MIMKVRNIEKFNYVKMEGSSTTEDSLPSAFALTLFHIIFCYPDNITVVSRDSR